MVSGLLWVPQSQVRGNLTIAAGTTLENAFSDLGVNKGDGIARGFGGYKFTENGPVEAGWHGFYFARAFTSGERTTAFRSFPDVRGGVYWPPVLTAVGSPVQQFEAYDADGVAYVADVNWDFTFKEAYKGPCLCTVEFFASDEPHSITLPTQMRPQGGTFYYGIGQVTLPECLRTSLTLTYTTGTASARYPYQTFSKTFDATNVSDWPTSVVIDDGQVFDRGLYIRRKVTAGKPY